MRSTRENFKFTKLQETQGECKVTIHSPMISVTLYLDSPSSSINSACMELEALNWKKQDTNEATRQALQRKKADCLKMDAQ